LAVAVAISIPLDHPRSLLSEVSLWKLVPEQLGKDAVLDLCMPKARGEFLVAGAAFPREGQPAIACAPRVSIGAMDKTLRVVGDRVWRSGVASDPKPFTEMPITWQNAFGGPDRPENPLGKGAAKIQTAEGEVQPLPNIEDVKYPVKSPRDRPPPAGFGPYDLTWPQRFKKAGTYDRQWLKERFPGFAADIDWTIFNAAPDDQQLDGFFHGDEPIAIEFMHPTKARIESRLPGAAARCFVNVRTPAGEDLQEVALKLDTVWLFPRVERAIALFHGSAKVAEDDAVDVQQIIAAIEEIGCPKPVEHYRRVLAERLDKEKGAVAGLRDADLMPDWPTEAAVAESNGMEATVGEDLLRKNARKRACRQVEKNRAYLLAKGYDPADFQLPDFSREEPPLSPEQALEMAAKQQAEMEARRPALEAARAASQKKIAERIAAGGQGPELAAARMQAAVGGPPRFSARARVERLQAAADRASAAGGDPAPFLALATDPKLRKLAEESERQLGEAYRASAHLGQAATVEREQALRLRQTTAEAAEKKGSLAGRDLTGADLSGLDLSGLDLTGALLEGVKLAQAKLAGANLSGAVLAHADLTGADLTGANLAGANLGSACLRGARAAGANLEGAVLFKADLSETDLTGARLAKASLLEAVFSGANLSKVHGSQLVFFKSNLSGLDFSEAELSRACFLQVVVEGANFSGSCLDAAVFLAAQGRGARFQRARLRKLRFVQDCAFEDADFSEADLTGANLRGSNLQGCRFSRARLGAADLSDCNLRRAHLDRAVARELRLVKADLTQASALGADLMGASFMKATIRGMDLRASSCYGADLARVLTDDKVKLDVANLKKVRIDPTRVR
jgi:uncharacterized protein YjbI with pentapeptide repeats